MVQSDHLVLFTWLSFEPMLSKRQPRINKQKITDYYADASAHDVAGFRKNFLEHFFSVRNQFIENSVLQVILKKPKKESINIQTRLQDKIIPFKDPTAELSKKAQHDIIQHMAKEKKSSTIITGFEQNGNVLTGNKLYNELFKEVNRKFNPLGLDYKII